ncbi:MAG: hypothetical protein JXB38_18920, partial [Anaerolineales bacterium]|nr:hypothetical protein [Anaerolineales bacterium]
MKGEKHMNRRIIILTTIIIITAILILIWVLSPLLVQEYQVDIISREEINIGKGKSINILKYIGEQTLSCFLNDDQIIIYDIEAKVDISNLFIEDVLLLEFTNDPQFFLGVRDKIIAGLDSTLKCNRWMLKEYLIRGEEIKTFPGT